MGASWQMPKDPHPKGIADSNETGLHDEASPVQACPRTSLADNESTIVDDGGRGAEVGLLRPLHLRLQLGVGEARHLLLQLGVAHQVLDELFCFVLGHVISPGFGFVLRNNNRGVLGQGSWKRTSGPSAGRHLGCACCSSDSVVVVLRCSPSLGRRRLRRRNETPSNARAGAAWGGGEGGTAAQGAFAHPPRCAPVPLVSLRHVEPLPSTCRAG